MHGMCVAQERLLDRVLGDEAVYVHVADLADPMRSVADRVSC